MSESDSNNSIDEKSINAFKWPIERVKLLIRLRLEMEPLFKTGKSKHLLWTEVYNQMKTYDPSITLSLQEIQKKYSNLLLSYKRIKRTSRNQTPKWEFFEDFDDVLARYFNDDGDEDEDDNQDNQNTYFVTKTEPHSDDSISFSSDDNDTRPVYSTFVETSQDSPINASIPEVPIANGINVSNQRHSLSTPTNVEILQETKKRKFVEISSPPRGKKTQETDKADTSSDNAWFKEFVKLSERREQIRHENQMEMERRRLEIETQKVQMLRELLDIVRDFVNK